ncbi:MULTISPECIES: winged helix-turn-helix domain-containing protein [unclassified Rhizobacter]|nr:MULTISPECIES: winged helix-turn-helix domain-containing protein [unclassified Rhizobacter]
MSQQCQYVFPPFRLDPLDATLWRDDERVPLTAKNFALLSYLVTHAGRLVTHDEILDAVWAHRCVSPSVLKGAVARLRAALADDAKQCRFIQTVNQRGYRFVANVDVCPRGESRPQPGTDDAGAAAGPSNRFRHEAPGRELERVLQAAPHAGPRIVVLTGEAGSGRSALVEMLLRDPIGIPAPWAALGLGDWCSLIEALCREQRLMIVIDPAHWNGAGGSSIGATRCPPQGSGLGRHVE